jgi:hypothetical protein
MVNKPERMIPSFSLGVCACRQESQNQISQEQTAYQDKDDKSIFCSITRWRQASTDAA